MHGNEIYNEISEQIEQGKGCIVFDFAILYHYPLNDGEELIFKFRLGSESGFSDMKLNHRYPNKNYYTISRKMGRRLCKCGYPYFFDLDENSPFTAILVVTTGFRRNRETKTVDALFPLSVQLTKDRPVCGLTLRMLFDEGKVDFISHATTGHYGWKPRFWSNKLTPAEIDRYQDDVILLDEPTLMNEDDSFSPLVYSTVIEPLAEKATELYLY